MRVYSTLTQKVLLLVEDDAQALFEHSGMQQLSHELLLLSAWLITVQLSYELLTLLIHV